jgi:hypothetical protein
MFGISPMLVWATDVSFDWHEPRSLCHVSIRKCAHVIATERVSDQNVGSLDTGVGQRAVQLVGDSRARARHGPASLKPAPARS